MHRLAAAAAAALALACARAPEPAPVVLVATVAPLAQLARALGGPRVEVGVLLPGGASPHDFEPRPSDLARLARARSLLRVGAALDDWVERLRASGPRIPTWTLSKAMPVAREGHGWLDPLAVRDLAAPELAEHLADLDPAGAAGYAQRRDALRERLTALDAEIRAVLAPAPRRAYVAFHRGWRPFAARYGLEELGVLHEPGREEPTPRSLARLVDAARRAGLASVVVEPQHDARVAAVVAAELGGSAVAADPLGDPDDARPEAYESLLLDAARAFARACGAGAS
jgi:ABC-type Zn uptake system ZnuABC Zn-binding protein ZnuA